MEWFKLAMDEALERMPIIYLPNLYVHRVVTAIGIVVWPVPATPV